MFIQMLSKVNKFCAFQGFLRSSSKHWGADLAVYFEEEEVYDLMKHFVDRLIKKSDDCLNEFVYLTNEGSPFGNAEISSKYFSASRSNIAK